MNARLPALVLISFAAATAATGAYAVDGATAPYNEAVKIIDGKRVVEVQPVPQYLKFMLEQGRTPDQLGPLSTVVEEVETPMGLMDCANLPYYDPKVCNPTSFGKVKKPREWVVKLGGRWQMCIGRLKPIQCIPMVHDGVLRALPGYQPE